jgi:hypothetical protein
MTVPIAHFSSRMPVDKMTVGRTPVGQMFFDEMTRHRFEHKRRNRRQTSKSSFPLETKMRVAAVAESLEHLTWKEIVNI